MGFALCPLPIPSETLLNPCDDWRLRIPPRSCCLLCCVYVRTRVSNQEVVELSETTFLRSHLPTLFFLQPLLGAAAAAAGAAAAAAAVTPRGGGQLLQLFLLLLTIKKNLLNNITEVNGIP